MQLLPGDGVLFYTDGITEYGRKNGERISVEEIKLTLDKIPELSAHETLENLINELMIESKDVKNPPEDQTGIYLKLE
jgi:serine phosphatase RsbU (regulator of sigma subunit)